MIEAEKEILKEALEYYAFSHNRFGNAPDNGKRAREALRKVMRMEVQREGEEEHGHAGGGEDE